MIRKITETELPSILYKYRDWTNKFHRRLISKQEIYFAKPSEFNDPFDGNIPIRWDLMTYEECVDKNIELINTVHKDKDQRQVREYAQKITKEKTLWHPDRLAKERPEQLAKWNAVIGLFSLSSIPDNILMWSHYALNHSGFAVGFDTKSFASDYDFEYIEPINYQTSYPTISGLDDGTTQFHKKFFYKSNLWSYEKEWRISINHIKKRIIKLKTETIRQIIIGCIADTKRISEITTLSRKKLGTDIEIFKATKAENEFGLKLERIE